MRVLVDECPPRQLRQWLLSARPEWTVSVLAFPTHRAKLVREAVAALTQSLPRVLRGQKAIMDLASAATWGDAKLAEVVTRDDIARHNFTL